MNWQTLLAEQREWAGENLPYDHCAPLRVGAFRAFAGQAQAVQRAEAFAAVLQGGLLAEDGGAIVGNPRFFRGANPPPGMDEAEYTRRMAEWKERGQRDFGAGFDHTLADIPHLLEVGVARLLAEADQSLHRHSGEDQRIFLRACQRSLQAFSTWILRWAEAAEANGNLAGAASCRAVALDPPRRFRDALQLIWLLHLAFKSEGRCHMALGRLDQYLWALFQRDRQTGRLSEDEALDLLCHLWVRLDEIGEVQNICIGGQTPAGQDAVNELSYLMLKATGLVGSPHTNLSARFYDGTPEAFHQACFELIRTGIGFPAIFNDEVLIPGLVEIGIPLEVARDACMVGCIETMLPGKQPAWSDSRFNPPLYLLRALERAVALPELDFRAFMDLFYAELDAGLDAHSEMINAHLLAFPAEQFPDPFLSALTQDCLSRARDVNDGGALYPRFHGIAVMGLATIVDSLAALRKLVFEEKSLTLAELMRALQNDFVGAEALRQRLLHRAPKYGNDLEYVDALAVEFVNWIAKACLERRLADGGRFVAAMAANVQNISAGKEVGATPDGRKAYTPLSDAASPYFGRDENGPTAFLRSVSKPDYRLVLTGSVINMRFDPDFYQDEEGKRRFLSFTRYFVSSRIPELQFNFSRERDLEAALREPELYRDLVVRVSGFSARFVDLEREVQEDILRRRAHR